MQIPGLHAGRVAQGGHGMYAQDSSMVFPDVDLILARGPLQRLPYLSSSSLEQLLHRLPGDENLLLAGCPLLGVLILGLFPFMLIIRIRNLRRLGNRRWSPTGFLTVCSLIL